MISKFLNFTHTEMTAVAKQAHCVAWIDYQSGCRTLWIARAPDFKPIFITSTSDQKNQSIQCVKISESAYYLAYTLEKILPDGSIDSLLHIVDLNSMQAIQTLPNINQWIFNESKHQLLYVTNQHLNVLMTQSLHHQTQTPVWHFSGNIKHLVMHELQQKLAVCYDKSNHKILSIIYLDPIQAIWISDSFDEDIEPVWSPDGKSLAFIRKEYESFDGWAALPDSDSSAYSIMVFDDQACQLTSIWNSDQLSVKGQSSQEGYRPLSWLDNQQLIFCHEGEQWEHLQHVDITKKECTAMTSGFFLVRDFAACPETQMVFLINNKTHRSHYSLEVIRKGTIDSQLTQKLQSELADRLAFSVQILGKQSRYIVFLSASQSMSTEITLYDMTENQLIFPRRLTPHFKSLDFDRLVAIKSFETKLIAKDHIESYAQILEPQGIGQCPAIIYLHDGPGKQSLLSFQPSLEMSFHYALCQYLAHKGFMVLNLNYRGSSGYSREFREAQYRAWYGASEYNDLLAASKWLLKNPLLKHKKIGLLGKGWGGYLAALGLARDSQLFHAGVDMHGFHHFPRLFRTSSKFTHSNNNTLSSYKEESVSRDMACAQLALENSPWDQLQNWMSPVLLIYSEQNEQALLEEGKHLNYKLKQQGVQVESYIFIGEHECFIYQASWEKLTVLTHEFFKKTLST